jgi:UDP-perosamine 4-acetyltransferase
MNTQYLIIGSGGHARVLLDTLRCLGLPVAACSDNNPDRVGQTVGGVPIIAETGLASGFPTQTTMLVNSVGGVKDMTPRRKVFEHFKSLGYRFATLVHPTAFVAADVLLEEGVQVMAGAMVITGARIGANSIINTRASVDHDCVIGAHCHLAPGTTLSGTVTVGDDCLLGTGASVIQGIRIGERCIIGAGAAVVRDIPAGVTATGVPARIR